MYSDSWMMDQGLIESKHFGDLRDIVSRRFDEGAVVSLSPEDTLLVAHARMKLYDISQLPVLEGDRVVGILDETDLLLAAHKKEKAFSEPVKKYMAKNVITLPPSGSVSKVVELLKDGYVPVICEGAHFYGLITPADFLNYLRRKCEV